MAPKLVISNLEKLRNKFFWGAVGHSRKIIWASSKRLYAGYEYGGLQTGSLASKNLALLAKWLWRFWVQKESLWAKLITSIYGEATGLGYAPLCVTNGIWSAIIQAKQDIEGAGVQFEQHFRRLVGNGCSIRFWLDVWIGEMSLASRFRRLYALELNKDCFLTDIISFPSQLLSPAWETLAQR